MITHQDRLVRDVESSSYTIFLATNVMTWDGKCRRMAEILLSILQKQEKMQQL